LVLGAAALHAAVLFEPNRGQAGTGVDFVARTPRGIAAIAANRIEFIERGGKRGEISLAGARRDAHGAGEQAAPGVSHYATGADRRRWLWDVPRYARVRFANVYPGIDIRYHAEHGELEFDFLVAPGASASRIRLTFPDAVRLTAAGELVSGSTTLRRPEAWQWTGGRRVPVDVSYALRGRTGIVLRLGDYNRRLPLTIDPTVAMATYLGGSDNEGDSKITVGADGAIYVAGTTVSADFPASLPVGSLLNRPEILLAPDVYITRIRPDGSAQDWSLFIGGSSAEAALGLKRDSLGNLYLLGTTNSPNFPVTSGAYRTAIHPFLTDLFLVKLDAQTGRIKTSTFLGTPSSSARFAVDATGGVYVSGYENDVNFQTTPGAYQPNPSDPNSGYPHEFVLRLNAPLNALVYATFLDFANVTAMDVDAAGNAVLGGVVSPFPYPDAATFHPVNAIPGVSQNVNGAFVAKLNSSGTAMIFATELHGDGLSAVSDVRVAADGTIHILGYGAGTNFPQVNPLTLDALPANYYYSDDPTPYWAILPSGGGSLIRSTLFVGPQFSTAVALAFPQQLRLAFPAGGQPCFLNIGSNGLQQSEGGLVGKANAYASYSFGGTLLCVDGGGLGLGMKTMLPAGASFLEVDAAPDGTLVFTGTAQQGFQTTTGALQAGFGGGTNHDQLYPYALASADAFALRVSLANPEPQIQSVVPEAMLLPISTSGTTNLELYGSGFAFGIQATINGQPVSANFADSGHVTLTNIDLGAFQPGRNAISLSLAGPGGGSSQATFTGIDPTPSGVTISPATIAQGAPDTKIVIRANNLGKSSAFYWNGAPRAAQFVADAGAVGHFELVLGAAELASPFEARISVGNPAPGGGISADAILAVQPASGSAIPTLALPSNPLFLGTSAAALGPKIPLNGSGFNSSTQAYWDGQPVPVDLVSATRINIQPPSSDLAHWGAHDVYVVNGSYRSLTLRQYIARALSGGGVAATDPGGQRIYVMNLAGNSTIPSDLLIIDLNSGDLNSGDLLQTVPGIALSVTAIAVSSDGRYVYLGSSTPPTGKILRYDTVAGAVDLQWTVDLSGAYYAATLGLFAIPGSPESVAVWTPSQGVVIYDRDRPRLYGAVSAGFAVSDEPVFVTASRMYLPPTNGVCWRWMEYDAGGIGGGQTDCAAAPPPELVHDGGFVYLTDGAHAYVVSTPANLLVATGQSAFLADPAHRRVEQVAGAQFTEYNLDNQQQTIRAALPGYYMYPPSMFLRADGALAAVSPNWIVLIP
jgi:hypothetical protein